MKLLVVGGPYEGKVLDVECTVTSPRLLRLPDGTILKRMIFGTRTKDFHFWAPKDQTEQQTMNELIEAYRRCKPELSYYDKRKLEDDH